MRIGLLTHNYPQHSKDRQDAGIFIHDYAQELAKHHKVFVYCPNFLGEKEKYKQVPVTWFDWSGGQRKLGNLNPKNFGDLLKIFNLMISGSLQINTFIKENNIDFCLAAWSFPSGVFSIAANRSLGIPYATWSLGSDINQYGSHPIAKYLIKLILKVADTRFANSYQLCKKVAEISGKNCEFMPAITNFESIKVAPKKFDKGKFHFLFVGRFEKVKGLDRFIEALSYLKKTNPKFVFHMVGDGSLRIDLESQVVRSNLKENVVFHGTQGKSQVSSFMKSCDSLVISSRSESLPLVIIEAAKSGLPTIATDVGDCGLLINKYNIGAVLPTTDPKNWKSTLVKIISDSKFRKKYVPGMKKLSKDFIQPKATAILEQYLSSRA